MTGVVLGSGFTRPAPPAAPSPTDDALSELLSAVLALREAVTSTPAPVVQVQPQDLSDIVTAVQSLSGPAGPSAAEIALAVKDVLAPALPGPTDPLPLTELVEALKTLDFRLKGVGGRGSSGASALTDTQLRATPVPVSGTVSTTGLTDTELRASAVQVKDDFQTGEILPDQAGAGAVLTFTFASPVSMIWIRDTGASTTNVSRADPFGGTPTSSLGIPVLNGEPVPVTVTATTVKVYAPSGSTISVWGFRRT